MASHWLYDNLDVIFTPWVKAFSLSSWPHLSLITSLNSLPQYSYIGLVRVSTYKFWRNIVQFITRSQQLHVIDFMYLFCLWIYCNSPIPFRHETQWGQYGTPEGTVGLASALTLEGKYKGGMGSGDSYFPRPGIAPATRFVLGTY